MNASDPAVALEPYNFLPAVLRSLLAGHDPGSGTGSLRQPIFSCNEAFPVKLAGRLSHNSSD